jgi:Haem-degrading
MLLEEAQTVMIGQPMNVAVVDNGRDLKAFARMEDAWLGSIDIAINKALTSASFQLPTEDLTEMTQPGQPLYGLEGHQPWPRRHLRRRHAPDARRGNSRGHRRQRRHRRPGPEGRRGRGRRVLEHVSTSASHR